MGMKHGKKAQGHITVFGLTMRESLSVCPQEQIIWISGTMTLLFMALDIPAVRTNIRRVPMWPVYGIDYLARLTGKRKA